MLEQRENCVVNIDDMAGNCRLSISFHQLFIIIIIVVVIFVQRASAFDNLTADEPLCPLILLSRQSAVGVRLFRPKQKFTSIYVIRRSIHFHAN